MIRVPNSLLQQLPSVGVDAFVVYVGAAYLQAKNIPPSPERLGPLTGMTPEAVEVALATLKNYGYAGEVMA